jgi:hypothetical protein
MILKAEEMINNFLKKNEGMIKITRINFEEIDDKID